LNIFSRKIDKLEGVCQCPGDKSISQRIVMIGSLMQTDIKVDNFLMGADPISTMNGMIAIGASIEVNGNNVFIKNKNKNFKSPKLSLDLGNSGTGMRLMMGLISGLNLKAQLSGDDSLSKRPMLRVSDPLSELGALVSTANGTAPIDINGNEGIVDNWTYEMPIASAQVKSALLLAALTANKNMTIVEGKYTRDHTERMINFFGGSVNSLKKEAKNYITLSNKRMDIEHEQYIVAGDFSSSAFIIVAALISNQADILIKNVGINETRSGLITVLKEMNGDIQVLNKRNQCNEEVADIRVRSSKLIGIEVPSWIIPNIIDEIPILSIAASFADGKTFIRDAKELRVKESDRLQATSDGLSKIGVQHKQHDDGIEIYGNSSFYIDKENIIINSYDDHRIAMSFLIAGMKSHKGIKVKNCENIKTSFPNFIELMNNLGGNFCEI
jgi:3-phosphoshikimate 1-carboxyvinyltransferase